MAAPNAIMTARFSCHTKALNFEIVVNDGVDKDQDADEDEDHKSC